MRVSLEELKCLVSCLVSSHCTPQNKRFFYSLGSNPSGLFFFRHDDISYSHLQQPYGYSDTESGLLGATMVLAGLLAAIITARFLTEYSHMIWQRPVKFFKSLCPTVRRNDLAPLFVISTVIGVCSILMLPVELELSCELTRNTDGS